MKIPRNWDELTVGMYERLYPTFTKEYKNPLDKIIEQIRILTDQSKEEVERIQIKEYEQIKQDLEFLNTPIEGKLKKTFWLGWKRFRFETDARKLNGGSYMSAMHIQQNDPNTQLHQVLFNIAKPINWIGREQKIDVYSEYYEDNINKFKDIPMSVAYPIVSFFLILSERLTVFTEDYLIEQLKKMQKMNQDNLTGLKNTDG